MYQEQIFFHYILGNQLFLNVSKSDYFQNQNVRELFDIAKEHALRYKEPPSKDQMVELIRVKGLGEKYSEEVVTGLYNTKQLLGQYDDEWLENNVGPWIQVRNLDNVMRKAIAFMKTTKVTAENASEVVEKIRHMLSSETVIDFSFNLGSNFFDPTAHLQSRLARTTTGYDYIDLCLKGGWWKGSLITFLSGPKAGKSTWLGNLALRSAQLGHNTAYVTFELQEEIVNMRIGSNMFTIPMDDYEEWAKDQARLKDRFQKARQSSLIPMGELHVKEFGASTCSVNDLRTYLKKAEDVLGVKFDNVFVDYINIMKNWRNPNTENTYIKIKQIAEDLRAMAMEESWAIVTATQTNRSGWESNDLNITNISESAALLHTVDVLFGIITNAEMKARGEYYLKCLANRVSGYENTKKRYEIEWKYARITEDKNSPIQDMDFIINSIVSPPNHPKPRDGGTTDIHAYISGNVRPENPVDPLLPDVKVTGEHLF
jgi:KaiC/GvpD/RAD55 family RecA-like ATPase